MIKLRRIANRMTLLCLAAMGMLGAIPGILHAESAAATLAVIEPPVPTPNGDSGFVGSVKVSFKEFANGKIFYTLDGNTPDAATGQEYTGNPFTVDHTLTLKAVHIRSGLSSDIVQARFVRAKLPMPIASYGSSTEFNSSITCSLATGKAGLAPQFYYTKDGSVPSPNSTLYSGPLTFTASTTLQAIATLTGYDDSDPIRVDFTYFAPPASPTILPAGKAFSTKNLVVSLKSATDGAVVRYSTDPKASLDTSKIVEGDTILIPGVKINEPIILRAQSFKTKSLPSAVLTERYVWLPVVATPVPSRASGIYYDTMSVRFTSATDSASVRFNHGTALPTATSNDSNVIFIAGKNDTLTAIAFKPPQPQSAPVSVAYTLQLSAPTADKGSRQFKDTISVFLNSPCPGALIYYTLLTGDTPTIHSTLYNTQPIQLPIVISKDSTYLTAIAIKGGVKSTLMRNLYTKAAGVLKLADPVINPSGRQFTDSQLITISTIDSNAEIRYTENGSLPTATSKLYGAPFYIDSSCIIRAQAFPTKGASTASGDRQESYTLLPSMPFANPSATQSYADSVHVTLSTATHNGIIYYILGEQVLDLAFMHVYHIGDTISIKQSIKLQALTVLMTGKDTVKSLPLTQNYEIYPSPETDIMPVGSSRQLSGGFTYTNSSANPIVAKLTTTDGLGVNGFKEAGAVVRIAPAQPGQPVKVSFAKPANQANSLYRVAGGVVSLVTAGTQTDVTLAGDYFAGIDTLPPTISLVSQTVKAGDSTSIRILIKDNVTAPLCEIQSEGLAGGKLSRHPDSAGTIIAVFKNSGTAPKSLWFHAKATDAYNAAHLPKDPVGKYFLTQAFTNMSTPSVLNLGRQTYPWDMAGIPINAKSPITWGQVRKDNPDADLYAMVLKDSAGYLPLGDDSLIRPGMSFWLGSGKILSGLSLSKLRTGESESDGSYRITMHHGWNQISDPALEKLYWPFSRKDPKYGQYTIKGLHEFVPGILDYADTDSLLPWKGYFAYSYGDQDTVLSLYPDSARHALGKASAFSDPFSSGVKDGFEISLDFGKPIPLILGADIRAEDGFASEDELQLPAWKPDFSVWSQRGHRKLATDMLRFAPQAVLRWEVVVRDSSVAHGHLPGTDAIRVLAGRLPAGYEAWAVSKARGLKFKLEEGASLALAGQTGDTMTVFAGPLNKLALVPELSKAVVAVEKFAFDLKTDGSGSLSVNLSLPWDCRVDMSLVSVSGRVLSESHPGTLAQGIYRLPFARKGTRGNPQLGILRVVLHGDKIDRQITQKVLW